MNYSLPCFMGGKYHLTPRLDALAAVSHRFIRNRTIAPICQPSREAMMTGLIPHHSGALYDLQIDPDQRVDRLGAADCQREVAAMKKYLLAYMESSNDPQLGNFETVLAGGKPKVIQPPKRQDAPD